MGSKVLFTQVNTSASIGEVVDALAQALAPLGGEIAKLNNIIQINNGKEGVQFGFSGDFESQALVQEAAPNQYNITLNIRWKMNKLTIICLIVGFFVLGILWIVPILYLFIDPTSAYNNCLLFLQSKLPKPD